LTIQLVAEEKKESQTAEEKPKPKAKAPDKPLPQMMEEDVIPSLKAILESQNDIIELELSFNDNKVSIILTCLDPTTFDCTTTFIVHWLFCCFHKCSWRAHF